jgi:hypothetical protein
MVNTIHGFDQLTVFADDEGRTDDFPFSLVQLLTVFAAPVVSVVQCCYGMSHPGAKLPNFGCIWCKFARAILRSSSLSPEKSRHPIYGIKLAYFKLCCYSYLFSCVDVALWLVEVIRVVRAHFFVRDKVLPATSLLAQNLHFK